MIRLNKNNIICFILLGINPVLSFIYSLGGISKKNMQVLVFSFSLSLIMIYFPIMFDTSSNFFVYYYNSQKDIFDIYTYLPMYLKGDGFNFILFVLFSLFITTYCWSKICNFNAKLNTHLVPVKVFLVVIFCSFHYRDIMDLNRNITAYALVFFYIFYIKDRFKYGGLSLPLFVVVTSYIHISVMVLWFFYMVSRFFPINRRVGYLIIYISASLGLSLPVLMPLLENIISLMPGPIGSRIYFYIYGSEFGVQVFSLGQALQKMLNFTVIFLAGIYTLKLKNEETSKDENRNFDFILMVIASTMIVLMYMTLFERLNLATNFIYGYLLLRYYRQNMYNKFILAMITFRSVVINFVVYIPLILFKNAGVFDNKADIVGMALKPLYTNTFYLLDFKHGYSDRYLINHLLWGR